MIIELDHTTSDQIAGAILTARRHAGSPAMGLVGTLIVVTDEAGHRQAMEAANAAAREHPHRALIVIAKPGRRGSKDTRVSAEVRVGEGVHGESAVLRLDGEVAAHADSVVSPLLLPDSPTVIWWPQGGPDAPAKDPLGVLAQRRISDAAASRAAYRDYPARAANYEPGDTDLAWTRITPWRALLAAALDQYPTSVASVLVRSERGNASAELLAAWLGRRLHAPVEMKASRGPGITEVRLVTHTGELGIRRTDGRVASFTVPAQPDRLVALGRRRPSELLSEELRRLDPDDVYAETLETWIREHGEKADARAVGRKAAEQRAAHHPGRLPGGADSVASPATGTSGPAKAAATKISTAKRAAATGSTTSTKKAASRSAAKKSTKKSATKATKKSAKKTARKTAKKATRKGT